jgi:hypothetical protein
LIKLLQILALRLGSYSPFRKTFALIYQLALKLATLSFHSMTGVKAVLLRGSAVTGHTVPGLSDLDFEVITEPVGEDQMVALAVKVHQRSGFLQKLFPMLQSPFIRTETEWRAAREVPHEWLSHSPWRVVSGSFSLPDARLRDDLQVLALFRLCLRELTKAIPKTLFRTPSEGTLWPVRLNRDRLQVLESLALLLGQTLEEIEEMKALERELRTGNFLTRRASQILGRYLILQVRALNRIAPQASRVLSGSKTPDVGSDWLSAPWALEECSQDLERLLPPEVRVLTSSCGNRYSQFKLYVIPPDDYSEAQLAEVLTLVRRYWRNARPALSCCLSYDSPILLSKSLLPMVGLGFCSSFEGTHLYLSGAVPNPDRFFHLAVQREMVDGVFLLRKKLGLLSGSPDRFYRYLQDYFVGVYPALFLARQQGKAVACPREAARLMAESGSGDYVGKLTTYLESPDGLVVSSRAEIERDPLTHLRLLESFHRELV